MRNFYYLKIESIWSGNAVNQIWKSKVGKCEVGIWKLKIWKLEVSE